MENKTRPKYSYAPHLIPLIPIRAPWRGAIPVNRGAVSVGCWKKCNLGCPWRIKRTWTPDGRWNTCVLFSFLNPHYDHSKYFICLFFGMFPAFPTPAASRRHKFTKTRKKGKLESRRIHDNGHRKSEKAESWASKGSLTSNLEQWESLAPWVWSGMGAK